MYSGNIILLSPPGGGKGTLSNQICDVYDYNLISTGEILRHEKLSGSDIGNKIKDILGKGNLVPDSIVNDIISKRLNISSKSILDGFPRTLEQAKFLDEISSVGLVIFLDAFDSVVIKRIINRGKTSGREDDQDVNIINKRLAQYKLETKPLIDFYKNKGVLVTIDANRSSDLVFDDFKKIIRLWE